MDKIKEDYNGLQINAYVINLPERIDRRKHIETQFFNRPEFLLHFIEAETDKIGAVGLWKSIVKIIKHALENTSDDVIVICEDDHTFTEDYNREVFFEYIIKGALYNTQILFGGIGGVRNIVSVTKNLYWVDMIWCTQFIVIYRGAFLPIINAAFSERDVADEFLSKILPNKLAIWPFISVQSEFGYSDVTGNNAQTGMLRSLFENTYKRFERYKAINQRINQ